MKIQNKVINPITSPLNLTESSKLQIEDVSEESGEESDENDEDKENNGKMKTRNNGPQEDSTESDSDSSEVKTAYVSEDNSEDESGEESDEYADGNKENKNHNSKENADLLTKKIKSKKATENSDRSIQQIRNFGTKKRLRQRSNRNTAIESEIVPDSEDEIS